VAVGLHLALFLIPSDYTNVFLYVRNQFLAWSFLFSMVQILDFLKFHHMFGPWAIIISSLLVDLGKFMTVLFLFLIGFSMLVTAMNTPFYQLIPEDEIGDDVNTPINCPTFPTATETTVPGTPVRKSGKGGGALQPGVIHDVEFGGFEMPYFIIVKLFFALFGLSSERDVNLTPENPDNLKYFQFVFILYLLVTTIILINLLIAMMSDTYQRIQQQSDMEWKFGRSKLITSMSKTDMAPAPINLFTSWISYFAKLCKKARKSKVEGYPKFSTNNESNGKATLKNPGLFVPDVGTTERESPRPV